MTEPGRSETTNRALLIHEEIRRSLKSRVQDSHLLSMVRNAERALADQRSGKVEFSVSEAMAILGEILESRGLLQTPQDGS